MKLEDQVCSLELSKKLKELGLMQESVFYWVHDIYGDWALKRPTVDLASDMEIYTAFTVAEISEFFPRMRIGTTFGCEKFAIWDEEPSPKTEAVFTARTEANARAMMLIYLIEKGIVKMGDPDSK